MDKKIILSADSACDIGPDLKERYQVNFFPFHILLDGKSYEDGVDISAEDIYAAYREKGILPKTAGITPAEYADYFRRWVQDGHEVIHINLGSALSSTHQNCKMAAEELGHVHVVDSASLSTGFGLLVVKGGEMIARGRPAGEIAAALAEGSARTNASFVLDTLEFMKAGGRCSAVAAFGANLLQLKPSIRVNNHSGGSMGVSKKYRGSIERVLPEYVRDQLADRDDLDLDRIFITHSGSPASDVELVRGEIAKYADFKEVIETRASATISSHCGPRTLGVLFMNT
ncbi:DegV family protein [Ruminococcaceae bacterium OttesenSCG-928-I18]|nr:DegV family protein [Ruminococcaceae bacterium OttesenSCG-928-I18]